MPSCMPWPQHLATSTRRGSNMASIILQLHKLFNDWPDDTLRVALIISALIILVIALVPEQKALRMVTLAYVVFP